MDKKPDDIQKQVEVLRDKIEDEDESLNLDKFDELVDYIRDSGYKIVKEGESSTTTTWDDYNEKKTELIEKANEIEESKNPAYSGDSEDAHQNFKTIANFLDVDPMLVASIYWTKHVTSILSYAKDGDIHQEEEMEGRFADSLNYTKILYSLYKEKMNQKDSS